MGAVSARRLRKVPAVVLPQVPPADSLLQSVRLFDPDATSVDGGVAFGAGVRLSGPHPVDDGLAAKTGLPHGYAFVATDSGPFPNWLARGLAHRFGGHAHLPQEAIVDDATEVVIVHTPRRVSPEELVTRIGRHIPGLAPQGQESDGSFFLTSPAVPIHIRCDGPEVPSLRWLLPLALGPLRTEPGLHGYRFGVGADGDDTTVRRAVIGALELAHGVGGVATDRDRFLVSHPADVALQH